MNERSHDFIIGATVPEHGREDGGFADHLASVCAHGHNSALLVLAWDRIEAEEGQFSNAAMNDYAATVEHLRAEGIVPVGVLWDGAAPHWFEARGGWAHPRAAASFAAYASHAAERLAPYCPCWVPLAEPEYWLARTYHERSRSGYPRALAQMVHAHRDAAAALRAARADTQVGLSVRVFSAEPADGNSPWDFAAAQRLEQRLNHRLAERLQTADGTGAFDFTLVSWGGVVLAWFSPWQWRREWTLTVDAEGHVSPLSAARRECARFDEAMSALPGYRTPVFMLGDREDDTAMLGRQLAAVAARRAEEGGERFRGFFTRAAWNGSDWDAVRTAVATVLTDRAPALEKGEET